MRAACIALVALAVALPAASGPFGGGKGKKEKKERKLEQRRSEIDRMAEATLERLYKASPGAKSLAEKALGHAVFDVTKVSLGISGGGGRGVAVDHGTGEHVYMKMGTGGVNVGLGGQSYRVVFLFETETSLRDFLNKGWEGDASANAVAGDKAAKVEASFRNGVAYYQLTDAGLALSADLSGTKYWKNDELNASK